MSSKNAHNASTQNKINIKHRSILEIEKNDFELIKTDLKKMTLELSCYKF